MKRIGKQTKRAIGLSVLTVVLVSGQAIGAVIIDHTCTSLGGVPQSYTDQAKAMYRVWYGHTSHGSQITTGMENVRDRYGAAYDFNPAGSGGALAYEEVYGDLGYDGSLDWMYMTREQLNRPDNDRNVVMWSWCGGMSEMSEAGLTIYTNAMADLERDYPGVLFIYMTGHLDGSGESGNLNVRNNQLRAYCTAQNKILFDFADIESYDPDGDYFLNRGADDGCNYNGGNWAEEWCSEHPGSELCQECECEHSHPLNCNLKGRAFWWMMARLAGWNNQASPTPTPQGSVTFTPTPVEATPTPSCYQTAVSPIMPADYFYPGAQCYCHALICNDEGQVLYDHHLVIVLEVHGVYFFGPGFTHDFDVYDDEMPVIACGESLLEVIPGFSWPEGAGEASNVVWYGGILDPSSSYVVGDIGMFWFSWGE